MWAKTATAILVTLGRMPLPTGRPLFMSQSTFKLCMMGLQFWAEEFKGKDHTAFRVVLLHQNDQKEAEKPPGILCYRLFPWACPNRSFKKWTLCYF